MIDTDDVLGEVQSSKFNDAYIIEAYLNNFEGYAKGSDIMTKFGINLQNEITLTISRERYEDFIAPFIVTHNAKNAGTDVEVHLGTANIRGLCNYLGIVNWPCNIGSFKMDKTSFALSGSLVLILK